MQMNDNRNEALIYVCIESIINLTNQKIANPLLNAYILKPNNSENDRAIILSKPCNLN